MVAFNARNRFFKFFTEGGRNQKSSATGNVRYIPDLSNQIANTTDIYAQLPTVSRQIVARYIVRDNQVPYGSYSVALPNTPSTQCRIKVKAVGNIFYDMSNVHFTIISSATDDFTLCCCMHVVSH